MVTIVVVSLFTIVSTTYTIATSNSESKSFRWYQPTTIDHSHWMVSTMPITSYSATNHYNRSPFTIDVVMMWYQPWCHHWYHQQTSWLITNIINCWWITGCNGRSTAAHLQPLHQLRLCYAHVPHESHDLRSSTATGELPALPPGRDRSGGKVHGWGQHQGIKGGLVDDFTKGAHGVPSWLVQLIYKFWKLHGWWLKHGNLQSGKLNKNYKSSGHCQKTLAMDTPRCRIMDSRSNHGELDVALLFFSEQRPHRFGTDGVLNGWFVLENRTWPLNSYEAKPLLKHQGNKSMVMSCYVTGCCPLF